MTYRPEIDGLRTIAVVAVVLYHADISLNGQPLFTGGFLGVDAFFVISGFLITRLLADDLERGTFSILHFYERRARRLLPALLLVMTVSVPFAWTLMTTNALIEYAQSIVAALLFASNIFFWLQDSYTAEPSQLKPFLHTWSLALEEQYYIVFPVVLFVLWRFAQRALVPVLCLAGLTSLLVAAFMSTRYTDANFFLMPSRAWELLVGAVLALRHDVIRNAIPQAVRLLLPAIGLLAIACSIWLFRDDMPHPSFRTVIPVAGVALIILGASAREPVTRFLSTRPMVGVGLISYAFYLWHFPVFAFGRILLHGTENWLDLAGWIVLSLALAYLSWRFVEQPFRDRRRVSTSLLAACVLLTSAVLAGHAGLIAREMIVDRYAAIPERLHASFKPWHPTDNPDQKCVDTARFLEPDTWCRLGKGTSGRRDFLLIGDSHALAQASFFDAAARELRLKGALVSRSGCPLLIDLEPDRGDPLAGQCLQLGHKILDYAVDNNITSVFLAVRWNYYTCGEPGPTCGYTQNIRYRNEVWGKDEASRLTYLEAALRHTTKTYADKGIKLTLILQAPHQPREARDIFSDYFQNRQSVPLENYSTTYATHRAFTKNVRELLEAAAHEHNLTSLLDPAETLCTDRKYCPVGTAQTSFYQDDDHVSAGAVRVMRPLVQEALATALR